MLLALAVAALPIGQDAAVPAPVLEKLPQRVLYAGTADSERTRQFVALLGEHFAAAAFADYSAFDPASADGFDVVIFDAEVRPTETTIGLPMSRPELPEDWDRPSVLIGAGGVMVAESFESKLDWLCMCLDHSAHGLRENHTVFQGPRPIDLNYEDTPTPEHYATWPGGDELGATIPTLRIQMRGFGDGRDENGFRVEPGIVSTPEGFGDSPDTEVVSGGLNMKGSRSIAIGRQGNLVLWGFHARPEFLTQNGRNLFVNTVAWAAEFDGHRPLVRKVARSREGVEGALSFSRDLASQWEGFVEWVDAYNAENERLAKEGETRELEPHEASRLERGPRERPTLEAYSEERLRRYHGDELYERFRDDVDAYAAWYDEHLEYLGWSSEEYRFVLDENALALGLSNREVDSLWSAIDLVLGAEDGEGDAAAAERARAFLRTYTGEDLATGAEWEAWLAPVESRLFFSDVGGYRFFVEPLPPGPIEPEAPGNAKVAFAASLVEGEDGAEIVLRARLADGWHLYARVPPGQPYQAVVLGDGFGADLEASDGWRAPVAMPYGGAAGVMVWEGRCEWRRPVTATGDALGVVRIRYQVCDAHRCLRPSSIEVPIVDRR